MADLPAWPRRAKKRLPRDVAGAERSKQRGVHLAVDEGESHARGVPRPAPPGRLSGVGGPREHRFAVEHAADCHAVEPADQLAAAPGLERVRGPPGAGAGRPFFMSAPNQVCGRSGSLPAPRQRRCRCASALVAHALREAARHLELVAVKHHARVGGPPRHRLLARVPGKHAAAVRSSSRSTEARRPRRAARWDFQRPLDRREGSLLSSHASTSLAACSSCRVPGRRSSRRSSAASRAPSAA